MDKSKDRIYFKYPGAPENLLFWAYFNPRDLANVNTLKKHVRSLLLHKNKTFATFRVISCTILFRLFTDVSRTQFTQIMLVLGPGSTHLVTAANLWPRYDHIKSCVAVH